MAKERLNDMISYPTFPKTIKQDIDEYQCKYQGVIFNKGEKFVPEALVWNRIACKYKLRVFHEVVYYRDYLDGGLTDKIVKIRMTSPIASMMTYAELNSYDIPFVSKIKAAINYWRFRFCSDAVEKPALSGRWVWTAPIGYMMHLNDVRKLHESLS